MYKLISLYHHAHTYTHTTSQVTPGQSTYKIERWSTISWSIKRGSRAGVNLFLCHGPLLQPSET